MNRMTPGNRNLFWIEQNMTFSKKEISRKDLRNFGLLTGSITSLLFGLFLPWLFEHNYPRWPWYIAVILIVWALALPQTLKPVYRTWMAIGQVLGWVNTRIILSIMFYILILPVGLIMRLVGKDPMSRKFNSLEESYRVTSEQPDKKHAERPF